MIPSLLSQCHDSAIYYFWYQWGEQDHPPGKEIPLPYSLRGRALSSEDSAVILPKSLHLLAQTIQFFLF